MMSAAHCTDIDSQIGAELVVFARSLKALAYYLELLLPVPLVSGPSLQARSCPYYESFLAPSPLGQVR